MSKPSHLACPYAPLVRSFAGFCFCVIAWNAAIAQSPQLTDERLELTLFAEDPEIVTPIGMAIDSQDRVFVIESHTHSPPDDYQGPDSDRIKIFVDNDNDGRSDQSSVFADGIHQAMNLAFSPKGELYVVCAREVLRLVDDNQDGKCDRKEQVLKLVTNQRYAHNSLLSITFDRSGWMYVGRGNTGSDAYRFLGHDESFVEGFGDGGNVIRCRPDGTKLNEYATGFWNPFDLKFDRSGQLLLVDNDPDARGPNRLLRVVQGGDYGYKSMFGGSGTHPFQGWDGSLPGTLPYLAGTGEAPSGLIDVRRTSLPTDYDRSVFTTIWNENSIEQFRFDKTGHVTAKSIFMSGDQEFRPVALDCDSRGNLFITDWVLVDYPNHGRGRIWRVSTKTGADQLRPEHYFAAYGNSESENRLAMIARANGPQLVRQLARGEIVDPLERHAVVMRLAGPEMDSARQSCLQGDASLRMVGLLASKRADPHNDERIANLLSDSSPEIRLAALMWAGETMDPGLAPKLADALKVSPVTPAVFEMYLAASEILTEQFVGAYRMKTPSKANKLPRTLDPNLILDVATDETLPTSVRSLAIKRFDHDIAQKQTRLLSSLLNSKNDALAIASIESLSMLGLAKDHAAPLLAIARDPNRTASVRTYALAAIGEIDGFNPDLIILLVNDSSAQVSRQADRTVSALMSARKPTRDIPASVAQWHVELSVGGDALLGRHVFFSARVGCSKCHNMNGRGGTLGPGLGGIARSKSREQIIDAILDPSADFAPQYQAWMVLTTDGTIQRGLQLDHKAKGAIVLILEDGESRYFKANEIEAYRALPTSLMPAGLEKLMTVDEFRDLVAYLTSLQN